MTQATGTQCRRSAIYLGAGSFGQHCYPHATPAERDAYATHQQDVADRQEESRQSKIELRRTIGQWLGAGWVQRRQDAPRWFDLEA